MYFQTYDEVKGERILETLSENAARIRYRLRGKRLEERLNLDECALYDFLQEREQAAIRAELTPVNLHGSETYETHLEEAGEDAADHEIQYSGRVPEFAETTSLDDALIIAENR
jgi:D-serine deaminase-like pyridoxal phosphate-dependent protein